LEDLKTECYRQLVDAEKQVDECQKAVLQAGSSVLDPGPEPHWWHMYDHWVWDDKKKLFDKMNSNLSKASSDLASAIQQHADKEHEHALLTTKWTDNERRFDAESMPKRAMYYAGTAWNGYIAPWLHLLLLIALASFAARIGFRYALLRGWTGEGRV
jgi:hypothetical protein